MNGDRRAILVSDAQERAVLAAIRGLGRAGFTVGAATPDRVAPGAWSRACSRRHRVPRAGPDPRGFATAVGAALEEGPYDLLLPGTDVALVALSLHRDALPERFRAAVPPHEVVERSIDRIALGRAAAAAGLGVAASRACADAGEAVRVAGELGYPVLVKPGRVVEPAADGRLRRRASAIAPDELAVRTAAAALEPPFLVERREPGAVLSVGGVVAGGRLLGAAFSRYLRTWRPEAGNVCFSRTETLSDGLAGAVVSLLDSLGWEGLFELELIEAEAGEPIAIDLNPRPYGSMALAVEAGANLPALWAHNALGEPARRPALARPGVRYRWEDADLRHALWQLRRGQLARGLEALRPRRRVTHAFFALRDPAPAAARLLWLAGSRRRGAQAP